MILVGLKLMLCVLVLVGIFHHVVAADETFQCHLHTGTDVAALNRTENCTELQICYISWIQEVGTITILEQGCFTSLRKNELMYRYCHTSTCATAAVKNPPKERFCCCHEDLCNSVDDWSRRKRPKASNDSILTLRQKLMIMGLVLIVAVYLIIFVALCKIMLYEIFKVPIPGAEISKRKVIERQDTSHV